jgi:hypothetical protein
MADDVMRLIAVAPAHVPFSIADEPSFPTVNLPLTHLSSITYPHFTQNIPRTIMNMSRTWSKDMVRNLIEAAAEIASLAVFGSAVAVWALALSPMA